MLFPQPHKKSNKNLQNEIFENSIADDSWHDGFGHSVECYNKPQVLVSRISERKY